MATYFVRARGKILGPFSMQQLKDLRSRGRLSSAHEVSEDRANWIQASTLTDLRSASRTHVEDEALQLVGQGSCMISETASSVPSRFFFLDQGGVRKGPVTETDLMSFLATGRVLPSTLVWREGMTQWRPLHSAVDGVATRMPPLPQQGFVVRRATYTAAAFDNAFAWFLNAYLLSWCLLVLTQVFAALGSTTSQVLWVVFCVVCLILALVCMVVSSVYFFLLLYRMWNQIQDEQASVSPGIAVGLFFIPFPLWQIVWLFVTVYGLARNVNRYMARHACHGQKASEVLALMACIFIASIVLAPIGIVLLLIALASLKNASVVIADASGPPR